MTSTVLRASLREAIHALRAANDAALDAELGGVADGELLALLGEFEVERRRAAAVDARVIGEVDARGLGSDRGARDTTTLLTLTLRIDPAEAKGRVRAALDFAARRTLTGQSLEPAFPQLGAALRDGAIHPRQAAMIARTIDALPIDVQAAQDRQIESDLVVEARRFAPFQLAQLCRRLQYLYDQDGTLTDDADRQRRREFNVRRHPDGSASGEFRLDPTTAEALVTALDAKLAAMSAQERGTRTPAQLRHDAFRDLLFMLLRTGQLPTTAGVTTTIIVQLSLQQWAVALSLASGTQVAATKQVRDQPVPDVATGHVAATAQPHAAVEQDAAPHPSRGRGRPPGEWLAVTNHGAFLTLEEVVPLLGDAQVLPVIMSGAGSARRIEAYGDKHRIFSENQRLAIAARDHGCSFVGCTSAPAFCEVHHVVEFGAGGPTTVDNGTLLCGYHHRSFGELGYRCVMLDGAPHWIAPGWVDPAQTPTRNTAHDPAHRTPND